MDCGEPLPIPHSVMLWDQLSTVGSQVVYQCNPGYVNVGWGDVSVCTASGEWHEASLLCQGDINIHLYSTVLSFIPTQFKPCLICLNIAENIQCIQL